MKEKKQDNRKKEGYCIVRNKTERYKKNDDKSERGKEKKNKNDRIKAKRKLIQKERIKALKTMYKTKES